MGSVVSFWFSFDVVAGDDCFVAVVDIDDCFVAVVTVEA